MLSKQSRFREVLERNLTGYSAMPALDLNDRYLYPIFRPKHSKPRGGPLLELSLIEWHSPFDGRGNGLIVFADFNVLTSMAHVPKDEEGIGRHYHENPP